MIGKKVKIAVTSYSNTLDSSVNEKFGRCPFFLIIDSDTMQYEAVLNPGVQLQSGAGPKAAEVIINKGVEILLTGKVGDKAESALKKGNIKIVDGLKEDSSVKDAVINYLSQLNGE